VDALAEEMPLDINALLAQLDKLLIQTTSANVSLNQPVLHFKLDFQEIAKTVVDAKLVISQLKFQMHNKLPVSTDQRPNVIALKEEMVWDTLASNAQSDKLETQIISPKIDALPHLHAVVLTLSNLLSPQLLVEDAKTATGHNKFQINKELLVLPDHS